MIGIPMKFKIINTDVYKQELFYTYITVTVSENGNPYKVLDIYCKKVELQGPILNFYGVFGVSKYGEIINEEIEYTIHDIRAFSHKMRPLYYLQSSDSGPSIAKLFDYPLLLTFQSNIKCTDFIEMISNGVTIDYSGEWNYHLDYSHRCSFPDYNNRKKFDNFFWHVTAIESFAHPNTVYLRRTTDSRVYVIGSQKVFNFNFNLWNRLIQITYNGDRAITGIQSDHDGGFEQVRQEYSAIYSRAFNTKGEMIRWCLALKDAMYSCGIKQDLNLFELNLNNPILNRDIELPNKLKDCNLLFNENDFIFIDGDTYTDSNPSF